MKSSPLLSAFLGLAALSTLVLAASCGGEPVGEVNPVPCGGLCPAELCQFGACVDDEPDVGDNEPDVPDMGGCEADGECAPNEFCQVDGGSGQCAPGCRLDNCPDGRVCDPVERQCVADEVEKCEVDGDCPDAQICLRADEGGADTCVTGCREDGDCPEGGGFTCQDNACVGDECGDGVPCPEGQRCDEALGSCVLGCLVDEDCAEGAFCDAGSQSCQVGCRGDEDCDPGESCLEIGGGDNLRRRCLDTICDVDGDCDEGFFCALPDGICELGCRLDGGDCERDQVCDEALRECLDPVCARSDECDEGSYCPIFDDRPSCTTGCDSPERCPDGNECDLALHACHCEVAQDCFQGQVCFLGRCFAPCQDDDDCEGGFVCNGQTRQCESICADDELEPNDSPEDATPLAEGSHALRMCHAALEDFRFEDCYSILMRFGEVLRVRMDFDDEVGDLDLRLYNPNQLFVTFSSTRTGREEITYLAEANGRHIVCVEPAGSSFEQDYTLDVTIDDTVPACLDDFNEVLGDDSCAEALRQVQPLSIGNDLLLQGRSVCEGDEDYVAVRVRPGQILTASLTRTDGVGELDVELVDFDCDTILAQSDTFGPIRDLTFSSDLEGVVFLRAFSGDTLQTGDYELTVRLEAGTFLCPVDQIDGIQLEPNDTADEATILDIRRHEEESISDLFVCAGDEDFYSVLVQTPFDTIRATLTQSINDPPLALAIMDQDGQTVLVQDLAPLDVKTIESLSLAQPGNYYVRVLSLDPDFPEVGVNYDLDVLVSTDQFCLADGFEPDNRFADASRVEGGPTLATMCRDEAFESDFFQVALNTGDTVRISVTYDHNLIAPMSALPTTLYGPGGLNDFRDFTLRDGLSDTDLFTVPEFVVSSVEAGLWTVEIGAGEQGQHVEYTLQIDIEPPTCDRQGDDEAFEPNESCQQAFALLSGERTEGFICGATGDEDFFSIDVEQGQDLDVDMDYFHFDGNIDIEVYEADTLTFVGGSFNNGPNFERVQIPDADAGTYCVRVFTEGPLVQNNYTLELTAQ